MAGVYPTTETLMTFDYLHHRPDCPISVGCVCRATMVTHDGDAAEVRGWVIVNTEVRGGCLVTPQIWRCRCSAERVLARRWFGRPVPPQLQVVELSGTFAPYSTEGAP